MVETIYELAVMLRTSLTRVRFVSFRSGLCWVECCGDGCGLFTEALMLYRGVGLEFIIVNVSKQSHLGFDSSRFALVWTGGSGGGGGL